MALSFDNNNKSTFSSNNTSGLSFGGSGAVGGSSPRSLGSQGPKFEGNIIGNINDDVLAIGAGITSLVGAIFGYDKEARQAIGQTIDAIKQNPKNLKILGDTILDTYNLTIDDFGKMPMGEILGNVAAGVWKHPVTAYFDVMSIGELLGAGKKLKSITKNKLKTVNEQDIRLNLANEALHENINTHHLGNSFVNQIDNINMKYSPEIISKSMQAIETIGFKNAPKELIPCMQELTKANHTYQAFVEGLGAKVYDNLDFATRELISKEHGITFEQAQEISKKTNLYKDTYNYVKENDIKPLFHLKPKIYSSLEGAEKVETDIFARKFGTMDYGEASKDLVNKAEEFVNRAISTAVRDTPERINKKILKMNATEGTNIKTLPKQESLLGSTVLRELNSELKKNMLSSGVYLGANIITTTLSILNNFNMDAALRTVKNLPKFRQITLAEATTPGLKILSRLNNKVYQPIGSIDRWLENVALEYIKNHPDKNVAELMQSTIPSMVVPNNALEAGIKNLVPFGSYPLAAFHEIGANIRLRPGKTLAYNQLNKEGQQLNEQAEQIAGITPDRTKVIRMNEKGEEIQRSTVITPIQAMNMFLFGTQGDAIQIPIFQFLDKLIKGSGDPNVFEVNGQSYRIQNGQIVTNKGNYDILPALAYAGRSLLSPVQFYNQVIVPIMSDKYIQDNSKLVNTMVSDTQYSNMNARSQRKVVDNAKERLGKRVLGTYEYKNYEPIVTKQVRRKIMMQRNVREDIKRALSQDE